MRAWGVFFKLRVEDLGCGVEGSGVRFWGWGFGFRVEGAGRRIASEGVRKLATWRASAPIAMVVG